MSQNIKIPFYKAVLMSINIMLGAAILYNPSVMIERAGGISFLSWIMTGMILFPIVWCVTKLSEIVPVDGGLYQYCRVVFGNRLGFISGWMYFISYSLASGVVISALRDYLLKQFPNNLLIKTPLLFFGLVIFALSILNVQRVSLMANIQSFLTVLKILPLVIGISLLPYFFNFQMQYLTPGAGISGNFSNLIDTICFTIFGFLGFEFACNLSHIIQGGQAAAKKAVFAGFGIMVLLYSLFHLSVMHIMGLENVVNLTPARFPDFVSATLPLLGYILLLIIPVSVVIIYFNSSNGIAFLCSTIWHSLASEKLIKMDSYWSKLNDQGRPSRIVAAAGLLLLAIMLAIPGTKILVVVCSFSVNTVIFISILALIKSNKDRLLSIKIGSTLALISVSFLYYTYWMNAGFTLGERLYNLSPIILGIISAILLYNNNPEGEPIHRPEQSLDKTAILKDELENQLENQESTNNPSEKK